MKGQGPPKPDAHWGLVCLGVAVAFAVFLAFAHFGRPGNGKIAGYLAGLLLCVAGLRWQLRRRAWFWLTIGLVGVIEAPVVIFIQWTNRWIPAAAILPFAIADFVAILLLIDWVKKWMEPPQCQT